MLKLPRKKTAQRNKAPLPKILFDVTVEDRFCRPSESDECLADGFFYVGGDGTAAAVVDVVAFAGEDADESVLDGTLQVARHVVVHVREADGHTEWLVGTISGAVRALHLRVPEVDNRGDRSVLRHIVFQNAAQAVLADGAVLALAHDAVFCHFAEPLFFVFFGDVLHGLFLCVSHLFVCKGTDLF